MAHSSPISTLEAEPSRTSAPGAVVIGGDYRGLGIVRSLGRRKIPVHVIMDDHKVAGTSRYCIRRLHWPKGSELKQLQYLVELGSSHRGWVLFPTGDETTALIARHHTLLSRYFVLTTPPWREIEWAYDKRVTYRWAERIGVPIPVTFYPLSREETAKLSCKFPALLKPAIRKGFNPFVHAKGWVVNDREELVRRYDEACGMVDPGIVMVQEMIPGGGEAQFSFAGLCRDGEAVATVTARRTRQYPLDLGRSSTFVETIHNPDVEATGRRLLRGARFNGIVEVEFKYDARDGSYRLLDVNPRVWGWHSLAQRAGVDFPFLAWQFARGEHVERQRARPGLSWVRMSTDLPAAAMAIRKGALSLPEYLRSLRRPKERAMFAADDPLPALVEMPILAWLALRRRAV